MLRQAPNIIMVGEIRDYETAEIAVRAALTGHLVFSTLHTSDAASAVTRLLDLGVKPFLVTSALRAVVAQRLVRRLCPECRPSGPPRRAVSGAEADTASDPLDQVYLACGGTGFHGRVGLFEILVVDDALRQLIHRVSEVEPLRCAARAGGLRTLREDGMRKVSAGLTTTPEVVSLTVGDIDEDRTVAC
jgi:type IV pilus assembly protein PilB